MSLDEGVVTDFQDRMTYAGYLQLDKLRLDFGPAGLTGTGRVTGLASAAPQVDGLDITTCASDRAGLSRNSAQPEKRRL